MPWPFESWEDWHGGLYALPAQWQGSADPTEAAFLLSDPDELRQAMTSVLQDWSAATVENLTNESINQRAWLGQAACCLMLGIPAFVTKAAWNSLSPERQRTANRVADDVIGLWRRAQRAETLFG